jgi:predicted ATP-grasp superfamily ATP-dependent carboligase
VTAAIDDDILRRRTCATVSTGRQLIVAGRSARALAESASRAGWSVTALDASGDLDLEAFAEVVTLGHDRRRPWAPIAAANVARVVPADVATYCADFEYHPHAVSRLAEGRRLLGNSAEVLQRVRTHRFHAARGSGRPGALLFAADGGSAVPLGLTRKITGEGPFGAGALTSCGSVLGSPTTPCYDDHAAVVDAATDIAQALTAELGLVGVNGLDINVTGGDVQAVGLDPRYTAAMELLERAHGVSVFDIHASACEGRLPRSELAYRAASVAYGNAVVRAREPVTLGDTRGWVRDPSIRDVPRPGVTIEAGMPICTIFAEAGDVAGCRRALVRRATLIYREVEPVLARASGA